VDLERHLYGNGTRIIKFYLHLSKEEQRKRFLQRIDEQEKNWKFSLGDIEERKFWKQYMKAYEECPQCDQHPQRTLVCRSRRRQRKRSADYFPDCPRYVRSTQNDLPQNERKAPAGIAVDPQVAREVRTLSALAQDGRDQGETMYTNILVPTDGSELAEKAVRHGIALAKRIGAKVSVLTVLPPFHTRHRSRDPRWAVGSIGRHQHEAFTDDPRKRRRERCSRLREWMSGEFTRRVLDDVLIPVLMTH
jgi:polyphosphate kinase 2 PPK2/universal stress protein family protein